MATPSSQIAPLTGDKIIDASIHGTKWILDSSKTIRWALANGFNGEAWGAPFYFATQLNSIFKSVSYLADVQFQYVGYYATPSAAYLAGSDITITLSAKASDFESSAVLAIGYYPWALGNTVYQGAPGDIVVNLNSAAPYLPSFGIGSEGYFLFLHEIGHALGLKHTFDTSNGRPSLSSIGIPEYDKDWFSIMSYSDDMPLNQVQWDPAAPMLLDALSLQYLYGPNQTTNAGDTVIQLSYQGFYDTVWDASGNDVINLASSPVGWAVELPEVRLSTLVPIRVGVAMPVNEVASGTPKNLHWLMGDIESVLGSLYADTLQGSSLDNYIGGSGGNDTMDGGHGFDVALYASARTNYRIMRSAYGYTVQDKTGFEGTDLISNFETISFSGSSAFIKFSDAVQALYVAYFGRAADSGGWTNFQTALSNLGASTSLQDINSAYATNLGIRNLVDAFGTSQESKDLYGTGTTRDFVTAIYSNVLNRAPDAEGLTWWADAIDHHGLTKGNAALSIMAGALANTTPQGLLDGALVRNKIMAASNFTLAIDTASEVVGYSGNAAAATVRTVLSTVTANTNLEAFQSTLESTLQQLADRAVSGSDLPLEVLVIGVPTEPSLLV